MFFLDWPIVAIVATGIHHPMGRRPDHDAHEECEDHEDLRGFVIT
jgi:hypothetical protein